MSGVIGEEAFGSQGLVKVGRGTLMLTAAETYSGITTLSDSGAARTVPDCCSTASQSVLTRIQLAPDDSGSTPGNRLNPAYTINLNGGTIAYRGNATAASSETIGLVILGGTAAATISSQNNGQPAALNIQGLTRAANLGTSVNFVGINTNLAPAAPTKSIS